MLVKTGMLVVVLVVVVVVAAAPYHNSQDIHSSHNHPKSKDEATNYKAKNSEHAAMKAVNAAIDTYDQPETSQESQGTPENDEEIPKITQDARNTPRIDKSESLTAQERSDRTKNEESKSSEIQLIPKTSQTEDTKPGESQARTETTKAEENGSRKRQESQKKTVEATKKTAGGERGVMKDGRMQGTSAAPPTTTLDPLEEFCQEACVEGYGGPECDCSDHPIG